MGLSIEEKKAIVADVHSTVSKSEAIIAAQYSGLSVSQMTELRSRARKSGVVVKIVKNTLAKKAVIGTKHECLSDSLVGPLLLVISGDDPASGARLVKDFSKDNEQLATQAIAFFGEFREGTDLSLIASMPTLDEARATLLSVFKAPQTSLVRVISEPASQVVRLLSAKASSN